MKKKHQDMQTGKLAGIVNGLISQTGCYILLATSLQGCTHLLIHDQSTRI